MILYVSVLDMEYKRDVGLPDAGIVSVNVGVHDTLTGLSTKVLQILFWCQVMKDRDHQRLRDHGHDHTTRPPGIEQMIARAMCGLEVGG